MNLRTRAGGAAAGGFALVITVVLLSVALTTLAGVLYYSHTSGIWSQRTVDRSEALAAAEAATELVVARMQSDFRSGGNAAVMANLGSYSSQVPDVSGVPAWAGFQFLNPATGTEGTYVQPAGSEGWHYGVLPGRYGGVGSNATYHVISNVRRPWLGNAADTTNSVVAAVFQQVVVAEIPVFSFEFFYNLDLELHPNQNWTCEGRVHSNRTNYFKPTSGNTLRFNQAVTAVGRLVHDDHPQDPEWRTLGTVVYDTNRFNASRAGSISFPFGPYDDSGPRQLIRASGANTHYRDRADLRISRMSDSVFQFMGAHPPGLTNAVRPLNFYDKREGKVVQSTEILLDVFYTNYAGMTAPAVVYVEDRRGSPPAGTMWGVRLSGGVELDADLTVATQHPLYVKGPYNLTSPKLASVAADAVTLLSSNWDDVHEEYGEGSASGRPALPTEYNMAVMTGIVPTVPLESSGGVLNALRLLENWAGQTLTFKGSICVPYRSAVATNTWQDTVLPWGEAYGVPAARVLSFNTNFANPLASTLPPATPMVLTVIRTTREDIAPGTIR